MPLKIHWEEQEGTQWALWQATEPLSFFREKVILFPEEEAEIKDLNDRKAFEWFSSRHLLHLISGRIDRGACLKDPFGKPYLQDSDHYISISHSRDMVAVMASPKACGIDIQYKVEKIYRIAGKFCSPREKEFCDRYSDPMIALHILWGAKESLYKAYGKRMLDFRTQIQIDPWATDQQFGQTTGTVILEDAALKYDINFRILADLILVYATYI